LPADVHSFPCLHLQDLETLALAPAVIVGEFFIGSSSVPEFKDGSHRELSKDQGND
jgi:hypothetical protein